jgi:hypothetical protein
MSRKFLPSDSDEENNVSRIKRRSSNYSRFMNDQDEYEYEDNENNEDGLHADQVKNNDRRKCKTRESVMMRTFNQHETISGSEFNTPIGSEKRSRSLISLRRRHWSSSSNRSASSSVTNSVSKKFAKVDLRSRRERKPIIYSSSSANLNERVANEQARGAPSNQFKNSDCRLRTISASCKSMKRNQSESGESTNKAVNGAVGFKNKTNGLNTSLAFMNLNKISKNLRKSFNDLYTLTKLNAISRNDQESKNSKEQQQQPSSTCAKEDAKENQHLNSSDSELSNRSGSGETSSGSENDIAKEDVNLSNRKSQRSPTNRYSYRLKRLKSRLIQTKNNLFNRKKKLFANSINSNNFNNNIPQNPNTKANLACRSFSSPHLPSLTKSEKMRTKLYENNKIDQQRSSKITSKDNNKPTLEQPSFVENVKSRLLKRSRFGLNAKTSTNSSNAESKRPKFY